MTLKPCQYVSSDDSGQCRCPTFVPRDHPTKESRGNLCDGCTHSIAWHSLNTEQSDLKSANDEVDKILSTYTLQSAATGSSSSSSIKPWTSEITARKEAVGGLRRTFEVDEEVCPGISLSNLFDAKQQSCQYKLASGHKGKKPEKRAKHRDGKRDTSNLTSVRMVVILPYGLDVSSWWPSVILSLTYVTARW